MSFELKYLRYKNKYLNLFKQSGGKFLLNDFANCDKFLLDDIYDLDDFAKGAIVAPTQEKLRLTLQHIIFAKQVENLLKDKLKIKELKFDELDFDKIRQVLPLENKYLYDYIFNYYRLDDILAVITKINKINSLIVLQFNNSYVNSLFEIIKKNIKYATFTLNTVDTCCLYNISFSSTFDTVFSEGNITRKRVEKKFEGIEPYNYTGLWFKTDKNHLLYYLNRAIGNQHKDSSLKASFFPTIRTFKIIKNIPNILIFYDNCLINVEILEKYCNKLKKIIPYDDKYNMFRKLYIESENHRYHNYFLVWMINCINEINPCSFDEQLNGWICPDDQNEIFIQNTKEYIKVTEIELISKIIYDDEGDPDHGKIIYENQNIINFINTQFYKLYKSDGTEINIDIDNSKNILPNIYQICNKHINLYPLD